ncbi:hypothetical protein XYCOK13_27880 [Xylanibacillus composti]|uniref:Flagellar protein n=1 Tax=Xylanibacillus composti TaxID=1572762 RepID=A0A8J4M2R0_9BACL|nr:TIGR03826 family flagellar region protein [Xylanibacillus composti]GIQ69964.1 hypothetical protein XYCOK13_27880 [Xylanibacillus composti]
MGLNVANCPRCGRIFARGLHDVCPACVKEIENEYEVCAEYLRENKGANMHELSEATQVSIRQITKFIREGRISLMGLPNMGFPCESCGIMIRSGTLCDGCRSNLQKGISAIKADQEVRERPKMPTNKWNFEIKKRD